LRALVPTIFAFLLVLLCALPLARGKSDTIGVSELRPGMKGYGMSVFRGEKPERFEVELIDVLHNFRPDQDLLLVRTHHPVLEQAIVVGGMSGSPIYFAGRLAGAYSYGWMFGKEPVAGVTPIASMLAELARPVDPEIWKALGSAPLASMGPRRQAGSLAAVSGSQRLARLRTRLAGLPPYLGRERSDAFAPLRQHARAQARGATAVSADRARAPVAGPYAASTPLLLSGLDERVVALLRDELEPFGLVALQAGGGQAPRPAAAATVPARFIDGGSIGVQLIRGDISATAIGTVTHVVGDKLVGFGHPMMNAGQPALPTCTARVLHVLASQQRSFKIAESIEPLGTLVHDRQAAIVVDAGLRADTVPMVLRLHGVKGTPRSEWRVELASQRLLTPMLAFSALLNALGVSAGERNDAVFAAKSRIEVQGHAPIELSDFGYTPLGLGSPVALGQLRMFDAIAAAYGNPFEAARIERIELDLDVRFERDVIELHEARVQSSEVDPGRDINVYLTLQRFGQPEEVKIVKVRVPERAAGQKIELLFQPGGEVELQRPEPTSLAQIFDNVRLGYPSTSLVISTKLATTGVRLRGHVVRDLPGSALDTLQLSAEGGNPPRFATQLHEELPLGQVVFGSARIPLEVREEPLR
jgi:hypothetical protein